MEFFLVGFFLWLLIVATFVFLLWGIWKKSWKSLLYSGFASVIPAIVFLNSQGLLRTLIVVPLILFLITYYLYKKK